MMWAPGPRRKEQWPHKRLTQTCSWVFRSLWRRPIAGLWALSEAVCAWNLLKKVAIIFITSTIVWHSLTGREHSSTHQQKIGLKIYWAWRHPSEQTQIPPLLSGRFHKPLILIHHQDRQNENCNHRKQTKLITWITASFNSIKLWALPHKANQDGRVMMESSDKMWSTGEENGKPLQFSCLENPMNSMKRQKDMTLKDELLSQ